jgi:hypothetical protein
MHMKPEFRRTCIAWLVAGGCSSAASAPDAGLAPDLREPGDTTGTSTETCPNLPELTTNGGLCNLVPFPTARVPFTTGTGAPPTFTGGNLVDGLYTAIKAEGWNAGTGSGRQMGLVLMDGGKTMLWFGQTLNADGSGDVDAGTSGLYWLRANFDVSASGSNTLALEPTCEAGTTTGPPTLLYTATSSEPRQLILAKVGASDPAVLVTTYERQGCPTPP